MGAARHKSKEILGGDYSEQIGRYSLVYCSYEDGAVGPQMLRAGQHEFGRLSNVFNNFGSDYGIISLDVLQEMVFDRLARVFDAVVNVFVPFLRQVEPGDFDVFDDWIESGYVRPWKNARCYCKGLST